MPEKVIRSKSLWKYYHSMKKMKIFLLGDLRSAHFIKWVSSLSNLCEVYVFTFCRKTDVSEQINGVRIYYGYTSFRFLNYQSEGTPLKILLYLYLPMLSLLLRKIKPDVLHSHYATGYGALGALTFYHPYYVSVWGSDIFSFPVKSLLHKTFIKYVLRKADNILATSAVLAEETKKYTEKNIDVIPFGIDTIKFRKMNTQSYFSKDELVIGTIKSLKPVYAIDFLIKVFAKLKERNPLIRLKLLVGGEGELEKDLKQLAVDLKVDKDVLFTGHIPNNKVSEILNMIDIFANLSHHESFGVAVLEASACEVPVIASSAGGLKEVVIHNVSGYIVDINKETEVIEYFENLIENEKLRTEMGKRGREMVMEKYRWENNVDEMLKVYARNS
jgi:L-malate glycosyltransferase